MDSRLALLALVGCSHNDGWVEQVSQQGHYRAEMPGAVVEGVDKQVTLPTITESHTALVDRGSRGSFQVSYYDVAAKLDAQAANSAVELDCISPFTSGEPAITEQRAQPLGTVPGYIVIASAAASHAHAHGMFETLWCVLSGTRMFHVLAVGPDTAEQHADTTRFIKSFQLR